MPKLRNFIAKPRRGTASATLLLIGITFLFGLKAQAQDSVRLNKVIQNLEAEAPAVGLLAFDFSLSNARSLSRSNLDFIIIDMEHSPYDVETLRSFLLGMTDKRRILDTGSPQPAVVPLARIPAIGQENLLAMTKQVLDVGVFGVMFPSINNAQEAEKAIRAMRYPQPRGAQDSEPRGLRGRNPSNAVWYWGVDDYVERADVWPLDPAGELIALIQIETFEAVENAEAIMAVPGVGGIFIGPSDLATDMGYERATHPAVEEAIASVLAVCVRRNIPCAITTNPESVERRLQQGFRIVTVGVDGGLSARAQQALQRARATGQ